MSFNSLASNQMVTEADAATGGFSLNPGQSHGSGNLCMTRNMATTRYNLNSSYLEGAGNQLMPKRAWMLPASPATNMYYLAYDEYGELDSDICGAAAPANLREVYCNATPAVVGSRLFTESSLTTAYVNPITSWDWWFYSRNSIT